MDWKEKWVGWRGATLERGLDELRHDSSLIESHSMIREAMYICPPLQYRNICMPFRMNTIFTLFLYYLYYRRSLLGAGAQLRRLFA